MEGLTEGRIVHYVLNHDQDPIREEKHGEHRPAIVVKVWRDSQGLVYHYEEAVQLQVFLDGANDILERNPGMMWKTSVPFSSDGRPGSWHWIEKA